MNTPSIYNYQDYRAFLRDSIQKLKERREISLREISFELGFKSPSLMTMILKGQRRLAPRAAPRLSEILRLTEKESKYFEALVHFCDSKSVDHKLFFEKQLSNLKPQEGFVSIDMEIFKIISHPIHFTILEMTSLRGFSAEPQWIQEKLSWCTLTEVREALDRLFKYELLEIVGKRTQKTSLQLTTSHDVPNEAIRRYHRMMIELAQESLEKQTTEERDITGMTVSIDRKKMGQAKALLTEFRRKFQQLLEAPNGRATDVYQLNLQFFRLTNKTVRSNKWNFFV